MNTPHGPSPKTRKRLRSRGGAPRGNQNARKHGRYSRIRPADRPAFMRKTLRSYGVEDSAALLGARYTDLADESNTVLHLLRIVIELSAQLTEARAQLGRRDVDRPW